MCKAYWLVGSALVLALGGDLAAGEKSEKKKLLLITESRGFQHGCVKRNATFIGKADPRNLNLPSVKDVDYPSVTVHANYRGRVASTKPFEIMHEGKAVIRVEPCVVEVVFQE